MAEEKSAPKKEKPAKPAAEGAPAAAPAEKKAKGLGRPWEIKKIRTTCPYCGVGCQQ